MWARRPLIRCSSPNVFDQLKSTGVTQSPDSVCAAAGRRLSAAERSVRLCGTPARSPSQLARGRDREQSTACAAAGRDQRRSVAHTELRLRIESVRFARLPTYDLIERADRGWATGGVRRVRTLVNLVAGAACFVSKRCPSDVERAAMRWVGVDRPAALEHVYRHRDVPPDQRLVQRRRRRLRQL